MTIGETIRTDAKFALHRKPIKEDNRFSWIVAVISCDIAIVLPLFFMSKRLRDEACCNDKSETPRPRGRPRGSGKQRCLQSCERFAREMEFCDTVLNNAKRFREEVRKVLAVKKCTTQSADLQSLPPIPFVNDSPPVLMQTALPLPELLGIACIEYPSPSGHTPTFKHQQEKMVEDGRYLALGGHFDMQHRQLVELPCPHVGAMEASQHVEQTPFPKHQPENLVDERQNVGLMVSFEMQHKQLVELPCPHVGVMEALQHVEQAPSPEHQPEDLVDERQIVGLRVEMQHHKQLVELPCPLGGAMEASQYVEQAPSPKHHPEDLVDERQNVGLRVGFEMQHKQSAELRCPQIAAVEASQVITSFMQKLTRHGISLQLATTPEFVRNILTGTYGAVTQGTGFRSLKEEMTKEQPGCEFNVVQPAKLPCSTLSTYEKVMPEEQPGCEESKVVQAAKQPCLSFNRDEVAEKTKEVEPETPSVVGSDPSVSPRGETILPESDVEDDDGLKDLWDVMEFSLACMNESKSSQMEAENKQNDGCSHDFYKKDDMGLVCSKCGLIGQDAEYIFDYVWGEKSSKRHSGNEALAARCTTVPAAEEACDELEDVSVFKQRVEPLALHPLYKEKLRTHQEEGLRFLECNLVWGEPSGCILAHAPGTGKSFTVIAFLQSFQTAYPDEKPLVVAPKGMLSVWVREFQKWKVEDTAIFNLQEAKSMEGGDYSNTDAFGHQLKRHRQLQMLRQWKAQKSILLVGYSAFLTLMGGKDAAAFPDIKRLLLGVPGILILDEGHFPRNKKAQITQNLSQVHTKRRVLLSGTLFQNNFDELYNLYHLVKPDFMSSNAECTKGLLENFMRVRSSPAKSVLSPSKSPRKRSGREAVELDIFKELGETIRCGEKEKKRQAISLLRQLSQPFVHWYKGEILEDLPGLIDLTLFLKLTDKQQEVISSFSDKLDWLNRSNKTMKVCTHPLLLNFDCEAGHGNEIPWNDSEEDPRSSSKIVFILDLIQLAARMKEKVVLFSRFLGPFYLLERMFKKSWGWHLNREILKIEGRTSPEERESTIDRFNEDPRARILFASIKTCGEGISLIGASRIVLLEVQFNPMVSRQAISRAFRIGQRKKVFVYRLVGEGTAEEDAHSKACQKEWLAKQIFEGCDDEDYGKYCYEIDPLDVDDYFESLHLRENLLRCFRYRFA